MNKRKCIICKHKLLQPLKIKENDIKFDITRWYCCAHIDINNEMDLFLFKENVIETQIQT
jgi:hypothetical protein